MSIYDYTPNFGFALSNFDTPVWHEEDWARWARVDALLASTSTLPYVTATGSVNAYILTYSPAIAAYTNNLQLTFKTNAANTGAATINVNGLGVKTLKINGNDLIAADLPSGSYVRVIYDGTNFAVLDPKKPVNIVKDVSNGASGATKNASTDFSVEDDADTYIELLSPNINTQGYMFSRPSLSYAGGIKYDHVNNELQIVVAGAVVGSFVSSGVFTANGFIGPLTGNVTGSALTLTNSRTFSYTGDATGSLSFNGSANVTAALTLANDAVTNAKAANMATNTIKGRATAGTGDPEDLTATQATAIINAMVPDSGSGGIKGSAPAPQAGSAAAGFFLAADGTWKQTVPASAVMAFASTTVPVGWLECNGAAVSRTTYAALFAIVATIYGVGDGSTTFNLPDLRGEFIRGFDNGRGVDSARAIGSAQTDEFEAHTHTIPSQSNANSGTFVEDADSSGGAAGAVTGSTGSTETRPRNIAMMYCIKF